jgi:hypothetical protein
MLSYYYRQAASLREEQAIQSDINGGTGVPPVRTAGTAVPRSDAQSLQSLCIAPRE